MSNFLHVQGIDPITLHESESFNKVRKRIVDAQATRIAFDNGSGEDYIAPGDLSFKIEIPDQDEPGRFSVNIERVIGVMSDQPKDVGVGSE